MSQRVMPVREDHWKPDDRIYDELLARCVADAEAAESRDGTPELMAGALILVVLGVGIMSATGSAHMALLACGLLAVAIFGYVVAKSRPAQRNRKLALRGLGGPGRLPAGFIVHPAAWEAGMADHVAHIPESQLRAAADLCHLFPGTVNDLIIFVGNLAIHVPAPPPNAPQADVDKRARALVRAGKPLLVDYLKTAPPLPTPEELSGKGRKKKAKKG
jgi:hypothetical protein